MTKAEEVTNTDINENENWVAKAFPFHQAAMAANPIKTELAAVVVGVQISRCAVTPVFNWVGEKAAGLFAAGAETAVEEAVEEEAVAASVGSLLDGLGKIVCSAFKGVVD